MGLFSKTQIDEINSIAKKSKTIQAPKSAKKVSSINDELHASSKAVQEYFSDSPAILIESKQQLHEYVTAAIDNKYVGIDTETTGLDRNYDYIVGASLYYPGGVECYIPMKHRIPIFEDEYKNQLSYSDVASELQRFVEAGTKLIFANANFDLYMIWKDLKVDLCPACYYDVILAWRCLKENELHNGLKELYNKYVLKGEGDPKRFSDFFSPSLFPYCKPEIAKLYAANDAKITYELFLWQLPYTIKTHEKCVKNHLENIADLIWQVEFPLIPIIQDIERTGMYIDQDRAKRLQTKYHEIYDREMLELKNMVQDVLDNNLQVSSKKAPFNSGSDFNPRSPLHVKYLCYELLQLPKPQGKESTGVDILKDFNKPITDKIVEVRSLATNISTFVDKLPDAVSYDGKIHANFRQIGAGTGRMSCISKDTLIQMPSGTKKIQDLKVDDFIYCFNSDGDLRISRVKGVYFTGIRECIKLHWNKIKKPEYSGYLICTPDHFIRTTDGWVEAQNLTPDHVILSVGLSNNLFAKIEDIEILTDKFEVYDITVEDYHNFIANELCVHNSSDPNLMNIPAKLSDIRQMFRASSAEYIEKDLNKHDNFLEIKLPKIYQVKLSDGTYVAIDKLNQNHQIVVNHKDDSYCAEVLNIDVCGTAAVLRLKIRFN